MKNRPARRVKVIWSAYCSTRSLCSAGRAFHSTDGAPCGVTRPPQAERATPAFSKTFSSGSSAPPFHYPLACGAHDAFAALKAGQHRCTQDKIGLQYQAGPLLGSDRSGRRAAISGATLPSGHNAGHWWPGAVTTQSGDRTLSSVAPDHSVYLYKSDNQPRAACFGLQTRRMISGSAGNPSAAFVPAPAKARSAGRRRFSAVGARDICPNPGFGTVTAGHGRRIWEIWSARPPAGHHGRTPIVTVDYHDHLR